MALDQPTSLHSGLYRLVGLSIQLTSRWTRPLVTSLSHRAGGVLKRLVMADHSYTWWLNRGPLIIGTGVLTDP